MLTTTWRAERGADGIPRFTASEETPLQTRWSLPERYLDLGHLAEGAVGEVRRVRDTKLDTILVMKVHRRAASPTQRLRFEREARLTARLHHPNIVPALDLGWLGDGTPWFTMPEVRGRTLRDVVAEHLALPFSARSRPLRRLVELLEGVARALGYAHSEGVVHRDVKPDNLMVGRFGDVRVMDFGVAMDLGNMVDALDDAVVGTPLYMAPEQARGEFERCGPPIDVYALGVILYEVLTGATPYTGDGIQVWHQIIEGPPPDPADQVSDAVQPPARLLQLVRDCMLRDATARPTAPDVADVLQGWLDGEERRTRALELVDSTSPLNAQVEGLRLRVEDLRRQAREVLDALPTHAPTEAKEPGWMLEDQGTRAALDLRRLEARYLQQLRTALHHDPECPEAHARLAAHHRRLLELAERTQRAEDVAVHEELLQSHDRGQHAAYLEGRSAITVHSDPMGASVRAERLVHRGRRWQVEQVIDLGCTPLNRVELARGNWRLVLSVAGRRDVVYPVVLQRGEHVVSIRPGDTKPFPIGVPENLHPDEVVIPAGWYETGGDPEAMDSWPVHRVWLPAYTIGRTQVTLGQYEAFLNALGEEALPFVPRATALLEDRTHVFSAGRWTAIVPGSSSVPVTAIPPVAAFRYAQWWAKQTGRPYRMTRELEWEKAARGADGRGYPWGDGFDPSLASVLQSQPGTPGLLPVGRYETDCSVFGVLDLGGNARDLCASGYHDPLPLLLGPPRPPPDPEDLWATRGGCWASNEGNARSANRFVIRGTEAHRVLSFRLVRSL